MAGRQRDPKREQFWRRAVREWARSGETIRGFCAERGLTETAFHAWQRELRRRDAEQALAGPPPGGRKAARAPGRSPAPPRFIPVRLTAASAAPVEIEHNGTTIRLHREVDVEMVARLVEALERGGPTSC